MKATKEIIQAIKEFEGLRLCAYLCPAGVLTIGYGHTKNVHKDMGITDEQACEFLKADIEEVESFIDKAIKVPLSQGQYDALVSFVFNIGAHKFKNSTMFRLINECRYEAAGVELMRWKYGKVKGEMKILPGQIKRRNGEYKFWISKS